MKVVWCSNCNTIYGARKLKITTCDCGKTMAFIGNDGNVLYVYGDYAVPIGINNYLLRSAGSFCQGYICPSITEHDGGWLIDAFVYKPGSDDQVIG